MAALAEAFVRIRPDTSSFKSDLNRDLSKADPSASAKKTGSRWGAAFGKAAGAIAAIGIVKFGVDSVKAFSEAETAQNRLSDAFTKFPKLADTNIGALRALNTQLAQKTRFDDDATASGQAVLAQFKLTGTQITQLTPLLQDYAAKTGKDLPTAARDLGKAMLGQGRGLKAVGINFKDTGTAGGNFNEIVKGLRTQVGGFAEKEGKTGAGQAEILKNQFGELQESVGSKLLPVLTKLAGILLNVIGFVQRNSGVIVPLVAVLGSLAGIIFVVVKATQAFTAAQEALRVVMALSPIGLIVIGIAALVAVIVIVATRTRFFQNVWAAAWGAIKTAFTTVFNFIKAHWPLILGILTGPIGIAVIAIVKNWDRIKAAASVMLTALKTVWQTAVRGLTITFLDMVGNVLKGVVKLFGWVPGIGGKLKAAAKEFQVFRDQVNAALGGVKSHTVTVSAKLQGLTASRAASEFATGGPVFGPGTATSDSIPAMLSKGEHVLTAREVNAFGGHSAVMAMRRSVVRGFAAGGPVEFNIDTRLEGLTRFQQAIAAFNKRIDAAATKVALASGNGAFSPNLAGVVNFAKAQAGKPYIWGSAGPNGFDCSGFVSNLVEVAKGLPLYRRLFATSSMRGYPWSNHYNGAFEVGWTTNAGGGIGHTGATVNGVNMESRGGDGVVVGSRSRGANYTYFNQHARLARGGPVLPGDPPFDILDPRGRHFRPGLLDALKGARSFDTGGWLPARSATVAVNNTNQAERVRTGAQEDQLLAALQRIDSRLAALAPATGREVGRVLARGGRA